MCALLGEFTVHMNMICISLYIYVYTFLSTLENVSMYILHVFFDFVHTSPKESDLIRPCGGGPRRPTNPSSGAFLDQRIGNLEMTIPFHTI